MNMNQLSADAREQKRAIKTPEPIHRNISILEWMTQIVIVCMAMYAVGLQTRWLYLQHIAPGDYWLYWDAADGIFADRWSYKDWIAPIFKIFHLWDFFRGYCYWCGAQTVCFMILTHKMFEVRYGCILVWLTIPYFTDLCQVGNIQIVCALAAISPFPSLLGMLVKPHYAVFPLSHALAARYRIWIGKRQGNIET
jgi:hypothetical protein